MSLITKVSRTFFIGIMKKRDGQSLLGMVIMLLAVIVLLLSPVAYAEDDYLAPEVAFRFSARMVDAGTAEVTYAIADGYYMYRERFNFTAVGAQLGAPHLPAGKVKFDETFQKEVETYRKTITIRIPVEAHGPFSLRATSQGCADQGLCYSPMESTARLTPVTGATSANASPSVDTEMGRIEGSLNSGRLLVILPLFLLLGLGLSFTPCVLPMVPILSSIIVGDQAKVSRARGLLLAAVYALGMAIVYTLFGVAAGLAGEGLAASLQNPWVLSTFALLMVLLSLSMFGVYQLQMPSAIQSKLLQVSERQAAGKLVGVFIMGALSALIVGPCVAAPLAGVLVYISHTRDILIGGSALFAMAVGMSIPLLLVGASAGVLLPRAGAWMDSVKRFFGVLMLATALWMLSPVIPAALQMLAWGALGVGYAVWLFSRDRGSWLAKAWALVFAVAGLVQFVGVATGGRDALAPLAHFTGQAPHATEFKRIRSVGELDAILSSSPGKAVMLDFYADWCVSCKEMERFTFSDPRVRTQFAEMLLLQADVTANNADDKALLKRFKLFGPPGIVFFDQTGSEVTGARVIGYQDPAKFLQSLARARQK
jgi:thiol:disulfide interchange protein DsbD